MHLKANILEKLNAQKKKKKKAKERCCAGPVLWRYSKVSGFMQRLRKMAKF